VGGVGNSGRFPSCPRRPQPISHDHYPERLGGSGGQVEAQWVGVVLAQEVGDLHGSATALAELAAFEREVFMVARDKNRLP
jgi:hypothetical protein